MQMPLEVMAEEPQEAMAALEALHLFRVLLQLIPVAVVEVCLVERQVQVVQVVEGMDQILMLLAQQAWLTPVAVEADAIILIHTLAKQAAQVLSSLDTQPNKSDGNG